MNVITLRPTVLGNIVQLSEPPVFTNEAGTVGAEVTGNTSVVAPGTPMVWDAGADLYTYEIDTTGHGGKQLTYHISWQYDGETYYVSSSEVVDDSVTGRYCSLTDIYSVFGSENVEEWTKFDGTESTSFVAARVSRAITYADSFIDSFLAGTFIGSQVPFEQPVHPTVNEVAATLAGVRLYSARGALDFDPTSGTPQHRYQHQRRRVLNILSLIGSGNYLVTSSPGYGGPAAGA